VITFFSILVNYFNFPDDEGINYFFAFHDKKLGVDGRCSEGTSFSNEFNLPEILNLRAESVAIAAESTAESTKGVGMN